MSYDMGVSFTNATSPPGERYWSAAGASSNGCVWLAAAQGEYLWVSRDYGQSWTAQTTLGNQTRYGNSMGNWTDCNVSPVGRLVQVESQGPSKPSPFGLNAGRKFHLSTSARLLPAQDGTEMVALDSYGYIWRYSKKSAAWAPLYTAGKQPWSAISTDQDGSVIGTL